MSTEMNLISTPHGCMTLQLLLFFLAACLGVSTLACMKWASFNINNSDVEKRLWRGAIICFVLMVVVIVIEFLIYKSQII